MPCDLACGCNFIAPWWPKIKRESHYLIAVKDSSAECGDDGAVEASGQGNPDAFIRREEPSIHSVGKCTPNIVVTNWQICAGRWLVAPRPCISRMYVKRWNHPTGDEIRLQRL